jgi:hypothetical protein
MILTPALHLSWYGGKHCYYKSQLSLTLLDPLCIKQKDSQPILRPSHDAQA